jgi:tetratricopeptide (TPR) repeat protein
VVTKSRHAIGRTADEHFMLARVQNDLGKWNEALGTLSDAGSNFDGAAGVAVRAAALEATVHRTAGNGREATAALTRALKLARDDAAELSHDATIDLARACFENERVEEGEAMLRNLVGNNHDSPALIGEVKRLFAAVGRGAEGAVLVDSAVADAVSLNNEGVRRAQAGDLEGAIALLETAAEKLPSNAHIVMNAAHSLIAFMLRNGPAPDKVARVRTYLDHIGSRQPEHPKYRQVATLFQQTQARLGVAA